MITEKFTLLDGIEFGGKTHRDIEMRPRKVGDSVNALENERAQTNEAYMGLVILAAQIIALGDIPKDQITADLLMDITDDDMTEINEKLVRLRNRVKTFRTENTGK